MSHSQDSFVAGEQPLASVRDRFSAQVLDLTFCMLLLWKPAEELTLRYGRIGFSVGDFQLTGRPELFAAAVLILGTLLYFFLFEWIVGWTPGKLLCGVSVVKAGGRRCGFVGALVRNILRPVDMLGGFVLGLVLMLFSRKRQRLGDRVAGTVVIRKRREQSAGVALDAVNASWELRAQAALIDLTLLAILAVGYLFATGSVHFDGRLQIRLQGFPLVVLLVSMFLYFVIFEGVWGATAGKLLSKLRIVYADGRRCDFVAATIRALFCPLNIATFGLPALIMSKTTRSRRHLEDVLTGTRVVGVGARELRADTPDYSGVTVHRLLAP